MFNDMKRKLRTGNMNIDLCIVGNKHLDPAKTGYQTPDINQRTVTGQSWRQLGTCQKPI